MSEGDHGDLLLLTRADAPSPAGQFGHALTGRLVVAEPDRSKGERKMKDPMLRSVAKELLDMSEEDMARVTPEQERGYKNAVANMGKYRLVAEVAKSKYCTAGCKVGQKVVINVDASQIDTAASDCPLCPGAIASLSRSTVVLFDRYVQNRDITASLENVDCIDPGFENGGLGSVVFQVRVEPIS
jgi:hypothetical protein